MTGHGGYGNPGSLRVEVEVVRAIYGAFAAGDAEAALPYVAEDLDFNPGGTKEAVGRTDAYRGREGLRTYFGDARRAWDSLTIEAEDIRLAAGGVVVFGRVEARRGEEVVRRRVMWTWQVRDGLAVSMRTNDLGAG